MKHMKRTNGFTVLELAAAVAVIGILATVVVPMFMAHAARAKSSEAAANLTVIGKAARAYFNENRRFPQGTAQVLPGEDGMGCTNSDRMHDVSAEWSADPVWSALGFNVRERTRFSYHFESTSRKSARAWAVADFGCNGNQVIYLLVLEGRSNGTVETVLIDPFSKKKQVLPAAEADDGSEDVEDFVVESSDSSSSGGSSAGGSSGGGSSAGGSSTGGSSGGGSSAGGSSGGGSSGGGSSAGGSSGGGSSGGGSSGGSTTGGSSGGGSSTGGSSTGGSSDGSTSGGSTTGGSSTGGSSGGGSSTGGSTTGGSSAGGSSAGGSNGNGGSNDGSNGNGATNGNGAAAGGNPTGGSSSAGSSSGGSSAGATTDDTTCTIGGVTLPIASCKGGKK